MYKKSSPRLSVKYIDSDTDEILFEINDRSHLNACELLTQYYVNDVCKTEFKRLGIKKTPQNIIVMVVAEFENE